MSKVEKKSKDPKKAMEFLFKLVNRLEFYVKADLNGENDRFAEAVEEAIYIEETLCELAPDELKDYK